MKKGFTIVELIIYMGLLSGFLLILTTMFLALLETQLDSEATSSVERDGRFIFTRLSYDVARAQGITSPAIAGGQSNSLTLVISGVPYTYSIISGNLVLTNDLGSNRLNSVETQISNLSVERLGNTNGKHTVRVRTTITSITQRVSGSEARVLESTFGLR